MNIHDNLWFNTFITALAPILWGTTYLVTTEYLPDNSPIFAATMRTLPVGFVLMIWLKTFSNNRSKPDLSFSFYVRIIVLSLLNITLFQIFLFISAYRLSGGLAAVIGSIQPIIIVLLTIVTTKKRPHLLIMLAVTSSVAGMTLLFMKESVEIDIIGVFSAFLGAICMACGVFLTKRWCTNIDGITSATWQLLCGGIMLIPLMMLFEEVPIGISSVNIMGYAYLAVFGSLISYALWFRGIKKLTALSVSIMGALSPITATAIGWLWLNQSLTALQILGFCIVIISVIGIQILNIRFTHH